MPATASLRDCSAMIAATREADGAPPEILTNIIDGAALLNAHRAVIDPAKAIVKASADGTLDAKKLGEMVTEAAHTQVVNAYIGELRQRSERMFTDAFHAALREGACDDLLDTLRPVWDEHAAAVAEARSEINPASTAEDILNSGSPKLVQCWQQLPTHLAALNRIASVARQFGPRVGNFPMIAEFANADGFRLEDTAIWCCAGNLEADSAAFRRPSPQPRQHPLFNVALKLNTLAEARERYRQWASAQWEQQHSGPREHHLIDGKMIPVAQPVNPFADADASVG